MYPFIRRALGLSLPLSGREAAVSRGHRSARAFLVCSAGLMLGTVAGCQPHVAPSAAAYRMTSPPSELATVCMGDAPEKPLFSAGTGTRVVLLPHPGAPARARLPLEDALAAIERLPEETGEGPLIEASRVPCSVRNHAEARALGVRLEADVVVWTTAGDGKATLVPHLTLLDRARKLRDDGLSRWAWGEVTDFDLVGMGSGRPEWLANLLVGLHLYRVDQARAAVHRLELAIASAREAGLNDGLHPLNALLGWASFQAESPLSAQAALRLCEEEAKAAGASAWEAHCIRAQADVAAARGDFGEARRRYDDASSRYHDLNDAQGEADCRMGMADIDVQLSDLLEARRLYRESQTAYEQIQALEREAGALKGLGDVALWMCDYPEAEKCYIQAHERYRTLGVTVGEALTLQRQGDVRLWLSDLTTARTLYEQALEIYRRHGDRSWEADCLMSLGNVRRLASEMNESRDLYEQALSIYRQSDDALGQAHALRAIAEILSLGTSYDDARFNYEQAMSLYKARGSLQGEASCLRGLAYLERSFGVGYAKRQYEAALFLSRKAGDKIGEAHSRLGLGQLAIGRMDYFEARDNFERARVLYHEAGYPVGEARSLQGLAEAHFGLRDSPAAQVFFTEAIKIYKQSRLKTGEMQAQLSYGQAAMRANDLKLAQTSYEAAIKLAKELQDRQGEADATFLMSRLRVRQAKYREAVKGLEQVRDMYRTLGVVRNLALASADLGTVLLSTGEQAKGKAVLEEATKLFEQIGMNGEAQSCRSMIVVPPALGEGPVGAR